MAADGSVVIDTLVDTRGFGRGMTNMKSQFSSLSKVVSRIGVTIGAAFSIKKALDLGSDLQEVQNVVDVTFTTMSEKVNEFAQAAATTAGLSETMAKKYVGTFGAMSKSFGFAEKDALEMSTTLTQLTGDVASFYNLTQDEAYTKLKSVFTGETESLKDLGVVMTQTALDSFAMAKGYGKTTSAMTEQEKVALRYQFVMEQLSGAQGDFLRTSDGWANQVRVLKLNVESFMATVGQGLINLLTPVIKAVNRVMSLLQNVGKQFLKWTETITGKKDSVSSGMSSTANSAEQVAGSMEETAAASKKVQNNLSGLDEISIWSSGEDASSDALDSVVSALGSVSTEDIFKSDEISHTIEDAVLDISPEKVGKFLGEALKWALNKLGGLINKIDWGSLGTGFAHFLKAIEWGDVFEMAATVGAEGLMGIGLMIGAGIKEIWNGEDSMKSIQDWIDRAGTAVGNVIIETAADLAGVDPNLANEYVWALDELIREAWEKGNYSEFFKLYNFQSEYTQSKVWERIYEKRNQEALEEIKAQGKAAVKRKDLDELFVLMKQLSALDIDSEYSDWTIGDFLSWLGFYEYDQLLREWQIEYEKKLAESNSDLETSFGETQKEMENNLSKFVEALKNGTLKIKDVVTQTSADAGKESGDAYIGSISYAVGSGAATLAKDAKNDIGGALNVKDQATEAGTAVAEAYAGALSVGLSWAFGGLGENLKSSLNETVKEINEWIDKVESKTTVGAAGLLVGSLNAGKWFSDRGIKLPYLAKGTVIPPNAPFAAILGDQKRGTNIEAPLDTIKQAVREVMGEGGSGGNTYNVTATAKGKTIFELVISEAKMRQVQSGKNPFLLK